MEERDVLMLRLGVMSEIDTLLSRADHISPSKFSERGRRRRWCDAQVCF